ncbi:AraC family transcriptional regulator [Cohnella terricola]|uniref:DNA gyrase inhibitor n=1 Tax=Cohnella terricola TaxID=1289167 RepID=A0A559J9V0_9BACL|nr:GyrI-like domain-containing protein [Cohnella terricola]TVX96668.1 DNA gyrase inhibitor [Cohnella terricola]
MITVETLPHYRIAYVRQVGPYGPANTLAMEKLKRWAAEKGLLEESAILLGIPQDNPETTPPADCRYDAGIVLSEDYQIDDSICESELSGGEYMICKVKHTAEDIQKAWAELYPALQNGKYQMDNKPILERYTGKMLMDDFCEICVPIKPL